MQYGDTVAYKLRVTNTGGVKGDKAVLGYFVPDQQSLLHGITIHTSIVKLQMSFHTGNFTLNFISQDPRPLNNCLTLGMCTTSRREPLPHSS